MNIFGIYLATISLSNAFGLTLKNFREQAISREMKEKGYAKLDKGTMYKTREGFKNFCLFFVPFYFAISEIKNIKLTPTESIKVKEMNGEIYRINKIKVINEEETDKKTIEPSRFTTIKKIYETPERYKASPVISIYSKAEEIKTFEEVSVSSKDLKINPFVEEKKEEVIDIIPYIVDMDSKNLEQVKSSIENLIKKKKEKELSLSNKDAA